MVADLAQRRDALHGRALAVEDLRDVLAAEVRLVELALRRGERAEEHLLRLLGQLLRHVSFAAAQEVGRDHVAEHDGALVRRGDGDGRSVGVGARLDGHAKLRLEDRQRAEFAGEHVVEERPELREAVLNWRACHDDAVHRLDLHASPRYCAPI